MKKHTLLGTILAASIVTAGSMALAQAQQQPGASPGSPASPGTETMPNEAKPMTPGATPSSPSDMSTQTTPGDDMIGKNVVNAEGEEIGEISAIMGNQVVVEVGGFLGIGAREVALDWSQITPTGMGDEMKLQTTLTKEELEAMPEYKQ